MRTTPAGAWRLNVLGPVELCYDGVAVEVAGVTRTLLALLARRPSEEIDTATIVAGIWGSEPPEDSEKEVASHISRLRRALTVVAPDVDPTSVVVTMPSGYILVVEPSNADILAFERLAADGRRALAVAQPELALARLEAALALWRGPAYADFGDHTTDGVAVQRGSHSVSAEAARLEDLRLAVIEFAMDARLAVAAPSAPEELLTELPELLASHWHRERLWTQWMTVLFRLGQRTDALAAYRRAEELLAQRLSATPGPELRAAERALIGSDPALYGQPIAAAVVPPALPTTNPACVGRNEELAWLSGALDLAATRRAQARLIVGSAGIGKSRIVAELAQRAAARGIAVYHWQADTAGLDALAPAGDALSLVVIEDLDQASPEDVARATSFIRSTVTQPVATLLTCRDPVRVGDLTSLPKLVLSALDDRAVAEIVRVYAPNVSEGTAVSAMATAGGIPARIHRAASEWAFARAGRRIDRAVADATEPTRRLALVSDEVIAGVLDLAHVRAQARPLRPAARDIVAQPYKGLAVFDTTDAGIFHGREQLVAELVSRLVERRLLAVVGAAGTGKSSLVRAGLLPALAAGVLPASSRWRQVIVRPGVGGSLAEQLASHLDNLRRVEPDVDELYPEQPYGAPSEPAGAARPESAAPRQYIPAQYVPARADDPHPNVCDPAGRSALAPPASDGPVPNGPASDNSLASGAAMGLSVVDGPDIDGPAGHDPAMTGGHRYGGGVGVPADSHPAGPDGQHPPGSDPAGSADPGAYADAGYAAASETGASYETGPSYEFGARYDDGAGYVSDATPGGAGPDAHPTGPSPVDDPGSREDAADGGEAQRYPSSAIEEYRAGAERPAPDIAPSQDAILLVVDQFEEVFTVLDRPAREAFLATMVQAAGSGWVVLTMRADFYPRCGDHAELAELLSANTVLLRPMNADELRRAVELPATAAGLELEDGLAQHIAAQARQVPGLAHLSTALYALWQNRIGATLTFAGYEAGGGAAAALEKLAENAFDALSTAEERDAGRRILLCLSAATDGDVLVRRRATLAEVIATAGPVAPAVLEKLAAGRLITISEGAVEVAHEALLEHWPRVRDWLDDARADQRQRRHLADAADRWADSRDAGALYRGVRLAAAVDLAKQRPDDLHALEHAFIDAGQRLVLAAEIRRRRRVVRLWRYLVASIAVAVLAILVAAAAVVLQVRSSAAGARADGQQLASLAVAEPDLRKALLLAVAATQLDHGTAATIRTVLMGSPDLVAAAGSDVTTVALSPDGRTIAAATTAGTIRLYGADSLSPSGRLDLADHLPVNGLAFTADGRRLVSWGGARTGTSQRSSSIVVWDLSSKQPAGPAFGQPWPDAGGGLLADGATLLLAQHGSDPAKAPTAVAWSIEARTPSTAYELPTVGIDAMELSPDGRYVVLGTADGTRVVDLTAGSTRLIEGAVKPLALSPDGRTLLTADGADVAIWDVVTGRRAGQAVRHSGDVLGAAWSPDASRFASTGADGLVILWDAGTRQPVKALTGHGGSVRVVRFGANATMLYTVGSDGSLFAWDLSGTRGVANSAGGKSSGTTAAAIGLACALAGRDLSPQEWQTYLPRRSYQHVCPA